MTCETLAIALASSGKTEAATRIANAVREMSKTGPFNAFPRVQTTLMALRAAMGDDAYERVAAQGRAMTEDDLFQCARSEVNRTLAQLNEA